MTVETPIEGIAAGVPFVALPPSGAGPAPLVVTWHLMEPPRSEAAMAAALPMHGVRAWRVHFGLPMSGARLPEGGFEEYFRLASADYVLNLAEPVTDQAASELPAAVAELRTRFAIDDSPIGVAGGSAGSTVALEVMARKELPIAAGALVSPVIQLAPNVARNERVYEVDYPWTDRSRAAAARFDFVRRAAELDAPLLVVVGEDDDTAAFREPAEALQRVRGGLVKLVAIPGMEHALAEEPGLEAAPQTVQGKAVDTEFTAWFQRHLTP